VKTTVEIPDVLFREAKSVAARQGLSLKEFFTEAVRAHLRRRPDARDVSPPWMKAFGGLRDLHRENRRIDRIIAQEFEHIDPEDCGSPPLPASTVCPC
jgi:hypothetical protein